MKITKRQLRRIIKEEKGRLKEYGGRPYDPTVPGDQDRARFNPTGDAPPGSEFDAKLEKMADEIGDRAAGGYEPSIDGSPEEYADHILDVYLQNPPPPLDKMEDLKYVLTKPMYREQVKSAVLEYIGMMTEGRTLREQHHSMSPAGKSLASSIKGKFMRMYPDAKVGIDGRGGFITVNGVKAIDMSQATGRAMSDEEMIDKMHAVYAETQIDADVPTTSSRMDTFREGKMRITKRQLKRIIKEEKAKILRERAISPEQAEDYLRSKADEYRRQGLEGKSMEMLLMDDFMDDLGHQHDVEDYEGYIRELVLGESKMRVTKKQLEQIIKEERAKLLKEQGADYGPDYDPLMEMYDIEQHLSDAIMKLKEVANVFEGDPEHPRRVFQLDSIRGKIEGAKQSVESHIRALEGEPA